MLACLALLCAPALAEDAPDAGDPSEASLPGPADAVPDVPEKGKWGGVLIPLVGASTVDGFGFGFGGEVFRRPPGKDFGYDLKLTPSFYVNTRFDYTNDFVRVEIVDKARWLIMGGYQQWANMSYAGVGGADVLIDHGDAEIGNGLISPYGFASVLAPVRDSGWSAFGQVAFRAAWVEPGEGTLMEAEQPFGSGGGFYTDLSVGAEHREVDRWPLPSTGHVFEGSVRLGGTWTERQAQPLAGAQLEGRIWRPLGTEDLVLGSRLLLEKSVGKRPFFVQDKAAGRWRDELGSEQALSGYGRTRTRGDGVVAWAVEVRPHFFHVEKGFFDLALDGSVYAEIGWLFDKNDPGPPLPTVGGGPILLWQRAVQLRPFLAWGWRSDGLNDPRRPGMQFGISVMDTL